MAKRVKDISYGGPTVGDVSVTGALDAVESGDKSLSSLETLKTPGMLSAAVQERLARVKEAKILDKNVEEHLARVRRVELMLQDDDIRVAGAMVKSVLDKGPSVAVQINNHAQLRTDPEVVKSLQSLGITIENEEDDSDAEGN